MKYFTALTRSVLINVRYYRLIGKPAVAVTSHFKFIGDISSVTTHGNTGVLQKKHSTMHIIREDGSVLDSHSECATQRKLNFPLVSSRYQKVKVQDASLFILIALHRPSWSLRNCQGQAKVKSKTSMQNE